MHKPRTGILRAKRLKKLKLKKELKVLTQFTKRDIEKCYKIVARRYFLKDYFIIIT
jgi:hypothetical protein